MTALRSPTMAMKRASRAGSRAAGDVVNIKNKNGDAASDSRIQFSVKYDFGATVVGGP